jgi:hypothetical protein
MSPSMNKRNTSITLCGALLGMSLFLSCDAQAEQTITITVPADATIHNVESSYCEPIYNEATNDLYIPRCWKLKQRPAEPNMIQRLVSRGIKGSRRMVEDQLGNGIDRQIYDMGQNMRDALGTDD